MKELIRRVIFYLIVPFMGHEIVCKPDSLKLQFCTWLYGEGEPLYDRWLMPDESTIDSNRFE